MTKTMIIPRSNAPFFELLNRICTDIRGCWEKASLNQQLVDFLFAILDLMNTKNIKKKLRFVYVENLSLCSV